MILILLFLNPISPEKSLRSYSNTRCKYLSESHSNCAEVRSDDLTARTRWDPFRWTSPWVASTSSSLCSRQPSPDAHKTTAVNHTQLQKTSSFWQLLTT